MTSESDSHLQAIAGGDPDAFASWVAVAEPRIRCSLMSFATVVDTESVVQECLLRVWQVAPRFKPDGKPDGLVRLSVRIARNLAVSEVRKRRPGLITAEMLASLEDSSTPDLEPDPDLRSAVQKCREELPARPRKAIEARMEGAGRSDHDLAESVNMALNTFFQNVRRARLALAECLERRGIKLTSRS